MYIRPSNVVATVELNFAEIIDEVSDTTTYICKAKIGSLSSEAVWQICRFVKTGTVTVKTWASGNDKYDKIADNRSTLSYE